MISKNFYSLVTLIVTAPLYAVTVADFPAEVRALYDDAIPLVMIPFDESMRLSQYAWIVARPNTQQEVGVPGEWLYQFLKKQWAQLSYDALPSCNTLRIPKIMHQIWIGNGVPAELKPFQKLWQLMHPDWEYHLWTQDNIQDLPLINRDIINAAQNPAEKADLLRLELLNIFGGVYIDMDFEPLQPLDFLHYCYDFYIGIDPLDTGMVQIASGIIGAIPNHPIIKAAIDGIPENYKNPELVNCITRKTGPVHVTRQFIIHANTHGLRDCALPASYFYPMGATEDYYAPEHWIAHGSLGVHHWAKTWNKPEYRRARFRQIKSWGNLL